MTWTEAEVECYSGHTYAQEPRAVVWQGRRSPVAQVEGRWRAPEGPIFRVRLDSGEWLELRYSELENCWAVRVLSEEACGRVDNEYPDGDKEVLT